MSETVKQFNVLFESFTADYEAFTAKGNKTAGTRARKAVLEMSKLAKVIRAEIQDAKK